MVVSLLRSYKTLGSGQYLLNKSRCSVNITVSNSFAICRRNKKFKKNKNQRALALTSHLPEEMGTLYLSEYRLLIGPTLCMLVGVMTEGPWVTGVMGVVGVVGV